MELNAGRLIAAEGNVSRVFYFEGFESIALNNNREKFDVGTFPSTILDVCVKSLIIGRKMMCAL